MRARGSRRKSLRRVAMGATAALLALIAPVAPSAAPEVPAGYIVQTSSAELAAEAVAEIGGELTHRLEIIDAVGARLSSEQATRLRIRPGVRIYDNRTAETATVDWRKRLKDARLKLAEDVRLRWREERREHNGLDTEYPAFIDADKLHTSGISGQGVTIAFLDTGVWTYGSQIEQGVAENGYGQDRILAQYNAIRDFETSGAIVAQLRDAPTVAADLSGHGTHISSVAVSSYQAWNKQQKARLYNGVAPNADLVVVKAFDWNGSGTYLDVIRGIIIRMKSQIFFIWSM